MFYPFLFISKLTIMFHGLFSMVIHVYHWAYFDLGICILLCLILLASHLLEIKDLLKQLTQTTTPPSPPTTNEATPPQ